MENVELVGIAYEIGECNDEKYLCIDIYEVWLQKENIEFKLAKKCGTFDSEISTELNNLNEQVRKLRSQRCLTRVEWLEKYKKEKNKIENLSPEDIRESSLFSFLQPDDYEKAALLCLITKKLGYFNLEDIKILYMIIEEYGLHQDVDMIAIITTFLAESLYGKQVEDTELFEKQKKKGLVLPFKKRNK